MACEATCLSNCSCTAFANLEARGGGYGCVTWGVDLTDLELFPEGGVDIFTRVAASELEEASNRQGNGGMKKRAAAAIATSGALVLLLFMSCGCFWLQRKRKGYFMKGRPDVAHNNNDHEEGDNSLEFSFFSSNVLFTSTDNFSEANILGKGGFGIVYKGKLPTGQDVAVKRLSQNSGQGVKEFKNEVSLIAKLQHRNLVRLLGCCIDGEEKMLIYEYMQNKSLDSIIFDPTRKMMLDWRRRYDIVLGIARGILYLHEDSRLKIIHRDLKASNVLLDKEMNPKISDFGLARIIDWNQTHEKTRRVVGTYGYMSPEYAMNGLFSMKYDVFSFGVILLEIVSGRKNNHYSTSSTILVESAWKLWKEERVMELLDSSLVDSCFETEVSRCVQVGLLCVEESPSDRPNMSSVVVMLENDVMIPPPKQPTIYLQGGSSDRATRFTINEVSITELEPR